ncbi:DSD1 family PLP-dependent enzyme [Ramlibacter sp.]|uniref:DSD1 family PLP-dependent enzyme n=1 Tax=Ramlibacter sp. TaxID=1917967 RepID=UPI002627C72C|nr:DSD1 family PLP-dependent enzyme [Ramlibacter sp.]MDB5956482.1 D-threonine aldolase [Ramlibacter sp.]
MSPWKAAQPGDPLPTVDTPALLLDLDAFERNLQRMAQAMSATQVRLRPHAKSHKCPEIARRQVALGAVGICCQKVSEAAVFVDAGIDDILVTNEIVGAAKLQRLAQLATRARIGVLVDHVSQVRALASAARAAQATVDVYVEVDVGGNRCGTVSEESAVRLAQMIADTSCLRFAGLQCYHGPAQHLRSPQQRGAAIINAALTASSTRAAIESRGIPVPRVTGGGTGTFLLERDSGAFDEVQPGSYVFMDRDYADNRRSAGGIAFEHALFVRTTVMSRPSASRVVVDAGLKASSIDSGMPAVWQQPELRYIKAADEHGLLSVSAISTPALGDALMLVPGHCDPTVNLYDELVCFRGDVVEAVWPIAARGALL